MQNTYRKDSANGNSVCCHCHAGSQDDGTELEGERQKCHLLNKIVTSGKRLSQTLQLLSMLQERLKKGEKDS